MNPDTTLIEYEEGYIGNPIAEYSLKKTAYPGGMSAAAITKVKERLKAGYTDIHVDGLP